MMNDPLREFVEKNRAEFDQLEAPVFDLDRLKKRLETTPKETKQTFPLFNKGKWLIAAAVLLAMVSTWLFLNNKKQTVYLAQQTAVVPGKPLKTSMETAKKEPQQIIKAAEAKFSSIQRNSYKNARMQRRASNIGKYEGLKDSSSASTRLLTILEIEKTNRLNNKVIAMLSATMNHDRNTNVRLAALSVLQKYSSDKQVSNLLINSLDTQNDPMVQLGLLSQLRQMKNVEIDNKLQSLIHNPETFLAVRDEAYNILLDQNKL
ncbi:MAG: hypothetical protein V4541_13800 [Bacteroidota bacterium]